MKKVCESLSDHAMKMNNFEIKKMMNLTNKQQESYEKTKICYICMKLLEFKSTNIYSK